MQEVAVIISIKDAFSQTISQIYTYTQTTRIHTHSSVYAYMYIMHTN